MAMLPDKVSFVRDCTRKSLCYRDVTYKYKDAASWDEEAGGPLHTGTVEKKCFEIYGAKIDFGKDAGLAVDISKKLLCLYDKIDVKAGGDSESVKAEIFHPTLCQWLTQLLPCGSQIVYRVRQAGDDTDTWHVRTPQVCCTCACGCCKLSCDCCPLCIKTIRYEWVISPADRFEPDGKIVIEGDFCCGGCLGTGLLTSRSRIFVDFPSGSTPCKADSKHALMAIAMLLDKQYLAPMAYAG